MVPGSKFTILEISNIVFNVLGAIYTSDHAVHNVADASNTIFLRNRKILIELALPECSLCIKTSPCTIIYGGLYTPTAKLGCLVNI